MFANYTVDVEPTPIERLLKRCRNVRAAKAISAVLQEGKDPRLLSNDDWKARRGVHKKTFPVIKHYMRRINRLVAT